MTSDESATLAAYLREMRVRLRGLPKADLDEILAELSSHVRDSTAGGEASEADVGVVLARLGSPAELASLYRTDRLFSRAGNGPAPWRLISGLVRWSALSGAGLVTLFSALAGYVVAASFLMAALVKPFAPNRVGLWRLADGEFSLRLGLSAAPPQPGQELLGFWIVPLGLLLGTAAHWLVLSFARWAIRRYHPSPLALRRGLAGQ